LQFNRTLDDTSANITYSGNWITSLNDHSGQYFDQTMQYVAPYYLFGTR
jgi:hypothetical protein